MTYGGSEFIKMIQKNNKMACIFFTFFGRGGGGRINWPGQFAPGVDDNQGGGQDIPRYLYPSGQAVQGGKINCNTGTSYRFTGD